MQTEYFKRRKIQLQVISMLYIGANFIYLPAQKKKTPAEGVCGNRAPKRICCVTLPGSPLCVRQPIFNRKYYFVNIQAGVFGRDSPGKVAQWTGRPIRES
jgi:hypothetical protein